jgi:hypothetical protein
MVDDESSSGLFSGGDGMQMMGVFVSWGGEGPCHIYDRSTAGLCHRGIEVRLRPQGVPGPCLGANRVRRLGHGGIGQAGECRIWKGGAPTVPENGHLEHMARNHNQVRLRIKINIISRYNPTACRPLTLGIK